MTEEEAHELAEMDKAEHYRSDENFTLTLAAVGVAVAAMVIGIVWFLFAR